MVPVFVRDPPEGAQLMKLDVLSQKIVPYIDGCRRIGEIATEESVQIDEDLVSRCIRNLHFHGFVALIPLFQYGNTYVPGGRVSDLLKDSSFRQKFLASVSLRKVTPRLEAVLR